MQPLLRKILHSEVGTGIRPAETAGRCIATTGCGPARGTGVVLRGTSVVLCGAGAVLRGAGAAPVWDGCDLAWNGCGPACGGAGMAVRQVRSCGAARCGPAVRLGVALRRGSVWPCGAVGCGPLARRCGAAVWLVRACGAVWRLRPVSLARSGAWCREAPSRTRQGRARRPLRARQSDR